jgi:hypothetical protein
VKFFATLNGAQTTLAQAFATAISPFNTGQNCNLLPHFNVCSYKSPYPATFII